MVVTSAVIPEASAVRPTARQMQLSYLILLLCSEVLEAVEQIRERKLAEIILSMSRYVIV